MLILLAPGCVESGVTIHNTLPDVVITAPLAGASFMEQEPFARQRLRPRRRAWSPETGP